MEEIHSLQEIMSKALSLNSAVSEGMLTVLYDIQERLGRLESCVISSQNTPQLEGGNQPNQLTNGEENGGRSLSTSAGPLMLTSAPYKSEDNTEPLNSSVSDAAKIDERPKCQIPSEKNRATPSESKDGSVHFPSSERLTFRSTLLEPSDNSITPGNPLNIGAPVVRDTMNPLPEAPVAEGPQKPLSGMDTTAKPSDSSEAPRNPSESFLVPGAPGSNSMRSTGSEHSIQSTSSYHGYDASDNINISRSDSMHSVSSSKLGSSLSSSDRIQSKIEQFHETLGSSSLYLEREDMYRKFKEVCRSGSPDCADLENMLIPRNAVESLREMVSRLIRGGAIAKCLETYRKRRRKELQHNLKVIGVENISKEEFEALGWDSLERRMKEWMEHMNIFVKVLLHAEKMLCNSVFVGLDHLSEKCFPGIIESTLMGMLRIGRDMASCKKSPEKVTVLLEMYDTVHLLKPEIEAIVDCEEGLLLRQSASVFLREHGNVIRETFTEFAKLVECDGIDPPPSQELSPLGNKNLFSAVLGKIIKNTSVSDIGASSKNLGNGFQSNPNKARIPLTSYVVNYVTFLCNKKEPYAEILRLVYQDNSEDEINGRLGRRAGVFLHLFRALIDNLEKKSRHFHDEGAKQIFLMNNFKYIFTKVSCSEVKDLIGDGWLRHINMMINERRVLLLKYIFSKFQDFLHSDKSDSSALAKRLTAFNTAIQDLSALRELHVIPDEELQKSIVLEISRHIGTQYSSFLNEFRDVIMNKKKLRGLCMYPPGDFRLRLTECFPLQ